MATYLIGDIQGCYDPLRRVLDKVRFDPANDRLWALGDLINRGPHSLEVVHFVRSLGDRFLSVLGNHDLHFLAVAFGTRPAKGKDTLAPLLNAPDRDSIVEWFRRLPMAYYGEGVLLVHAGVPPHWTLQQTLDRAREVEAWLQGPQIVDYLSQMYGDVPDTFSDEQDPLTRARTITNALTRLRFTSAAGHMNFSAKGSPESAPPGMRPWFEHEPRAMRDTPIAFGHWAMLFGRCSVPNVFALDTACVWGHELTLLRLSDRQRFSCPCR